MGVRRIRLAGFETDVLKMIGAGFRFSDPSVSDRALVLDRNLFDSDMPDAKEIAETASEADNGFPFDPNLEPALAVYAQPGSGIDSTSSSGSRLAFNLLLVLRIPRSLAVAKDWLGELVVWLELNAAGKVTEFFDIRNYETLGRPIPYQRLSDDKSAASATVRFLAVARL